MRYFVFMPGCGTVDAIFILRQVQGNTLPDKKKKKKKDLHFACIVVEKAFDQVQMTVFVGFC